MQSIDLTLLETALLMALVAAAGLVAFVQTRAGSLRRERDNLRSDLLLAEHLVKEQQDSAEDSLRSQTAAETRLSAVQENLEALTRQRDGAFADRTAEMEARQAADMRAALAEQARAEMEARIADWEVLKTQHLEAAKAAMFETSKTMSSKLLEDHKREAEAQKKDSAELVEKTTAEMHKNMGQLVESVTSLHSQVQQTTGQTEQILRALSNPAGAGYYAEIGLENMLREFGLELGRDFIMQHTIEGEESGSRLRPDAVVFLPGDTILTIDSKASKYLLEAADAEGTAREAEAYADLARTMNQHLRALSGKDYAGAIQTTYRKTGKANRIARAINIMYLPTDGGAERLYRADPEFQRKAVHVNVVVASPSTLMSYIGFARTEIDFGKRIENQDRIEESARRLINAVTDVIKHAARIGSGIKIAAEAHKGMVSSINKSLLPNQRKLANLGFSSAKLKDMPTNLSAVEVVVIEEGSLIEGESEDVTALTEATKLTVVRD